MLDHLADLEADFRAIYRIDDMRSLSGPRFFRLAWRVAAYSGVMAARVNAQADDDEQPARRGASTGQVERVEPTRTAIEADPILSSLISFA